MEAKSRSRAKTADATAEFFDALARRGYEPLLHGATGTVRFELAQGGHSDRWLVTLKAGNVMVSHAASRADCVVRADRALFNGIVSGEVNAMAAMLRGELTAEGDPELLMLFQRILPGPPGSQRRTPSSKRRRADG